MKTEPNNLVYPASNQFHTDSGITIRQHFAGLAMQGLLAADAKYGGKTNNYKMLAEDALCHADALIAELNRTQD